MKKLQKAIIFISLLVFTSCATDFFKDRVDINSIVKAKEEITLTKNPAKQLLLKNELTKKIIILKNVTVKDVVVSPNIDYDFCVIAVVKSLKGDIECFIFTKNIRRVSMLKKGETIINVEGEFGRYFSMLDSYYTKVEIINSTIEIAEPEKTKQEE